MGEGNFLHSSILQSSFARALPQCVRVDWVVIERTFASLASHLSMPRAKTASNRPSKSCHQPQTLALTSSQNSLANFAFTVLFIIPWRFQSFNYDPSWDIIFTPCIKSARWNLINDDCERTQFWIVSSSSREFSVEFNTTRTSKRVDKFEHDFVPKQSTQVWKIRLRQTSQKKRRASKETSWRVYTIVPLFLNAWTADD